MTHCTSNPERGRHPKIVENSATIRPEVRARAAIGGKKDRAAGAPRAQSRRKEATKGSAGAASKSADPRSKRKEPGADDGLINDD